MKNKNGIFGLILCCILMIGSCSKEEVEREKAQSLVEGKGVKINKEQKIVNLDNSDIIGVVTTDTVFYNNIELPRYQVEIEGSNEDLNKLEIGTIVNIPSGDKGGVLMFVTEVESGAVEGQRLKGVIGAIIKGFQVTLDMYFNYENAILEFSTPDNRSKKNLDIPNKLVGGTLDMGDKEVSFSVKNKDLDLNFTSSPEQICQLSLSSKIWQSGDSYLSLDGSIGIHPAVDLFMRYEPIEGGNKVLELLEAAAVPDAILFAYRDKNYFLGNMKELKANVYADIDKDLTVKFHLAKEFKKKDPFRIPIGNLTVPSVPVSAQIELAFEVDLKAVGSIDVEFYEKEEFDIAIGVDLDRELPEPVWYFEKDNRSESGLILKAKIELTAGLSLVLETEVYVLGIIGPEIKMSGFVEGTAVVEAVVGTDVPLSANWKLYADAGLRCEAKLNLSAFHIDKATWTIWDNAFLEYKENIYNAPDYLKVESGNNQIGIAGQILSNPIEIGVYDSRDKIVNYLPVPIYFETTDGIVDKDMVLTENGRSSNTWQLSNSLDDQTLKSYFKDGENVGDEVLVTAKVSESAEDSKNIALSVNGATATATSEGTYMSNTQYAYEAIDGDRNNGWSSNWDMPAWLKVEFDKIYTINKLGIQWGSHKHTYNISVSVDGNNWEEVISSKVSSNTEGSTTYDEINITAVDAKFIRVDLISTSAPSSHIFQASINELEVYSSNGDTGTAIEMVTVQGGSFDMGSTSGTSLERPVHKVTLSSFEIGKYEVTQAQWEAIMDSNPSEFKGANLPVENVSYGNALTFISKLNEQTGLEYRLPTEAEWEFAARGGVLTGSTIYSGSASLSEVAWYDGNSASKTHDVGGKNANELGIYDMSGNVWEWCNDWCDDYSAGDAVDPQGPASGSLRIYRGGSWSGTSSGCRVSSRARANSGWKGTKLGFRLARSL